MLHLIFNAIFFLFFLMLALHVIGWIIWVPFAIADKLAKVFFGKSLVPPVEDVTYTAEELRARQDEFLERYRKFHYPD